MTNPHSNCHPSRRFRFWIKPSPNMQPHSVSGRSNMSFSQYVKRVANADYYSDETGGGHPYNSLNIPVVGMWVQDILDMHPDHWRGGDGGTEWGPSPYLTGEINQYNYYDALTRFYVTWERHKDENTVKHEVRYAFQDIHVIGWDAAIPAPNGLVTPPGWQGYNGMVYDSSLVPTADQSVVYVAVKLEDSNLFKQIAIPLNTSPDLS